MANDLAYVVQAVVSLVLFPFLEYILTSLTEGSQFHVENNGVPPRSQGIYLVNRTSNTTQ
jgi:ACS family pantothenate transporter-like MFS transporter